MPGHAPYSIAVLNPEGDTLAVLEIDEYDFKMPSHCQDLIQWVEGVVTDSKDARDE